jgi:hypothetical protein
MKGGRKERKRIEKEQNKSIIPIVVAAAARTRQRQGLNIFSGRKTKFWKRKQDCLKASAREKGRERQRRLFLFICDADSSIPPDALLTLSLKEGSGRGCSLGG